MWVGLVIKCSSPAMSAWLACQECREHPKYREYKLMMNAKGVVSCLQMWLSINMRVFHKHNGKII